MKSYSLSHQSDQALLRDLTSLVARDRATTAELLAHIAEVDARKLYLPAAYPSMFAYCVGELHLSEDAAAKTVWNDRPAVVGSCRLREERPDSVARSHPQSRVNASGVRAAYERSRS